MVSTLRKYLKASLVGASVAAVLFAGMVTSGLQAVLLVAVALLLSFAAWKL